MRKSRFDGISVEPVEGTIRASLLVALVLALIIVGAMLWHFSSTGTEPEPPADQPPAPAVKGAETPVEKAETNGFEGDDEEHAVPAADTTKDDEPAGEPEAGLRLFGVVTDTEGRPIPRANVRWVAVQPSELEPYRHDGVILGEGTFAAPGAPATVRDAFSRAVRTVSNEAGAYELRISDGIFAGAVIAGRPGFETAIEGCEPGDAEPKAEGETTPVVDPDAPGAVHEVEINFTLAAAGSISGKVTEKVTGEGARGMVVMAGTLDPDSPQIFSFVRPDAPRGTVGADGTYLIQGLRPAEYHVVPRAGRSDYVSLTSRQAKKVVLEEGVEIIEVDFTVTRGGRIHGRITGEDKKPVAAVRCSAMPTDVMSAAMKGDIEAVAMLGQQFSSTGTDGTYEVTGLAPGKTYRLIAEKKGYALGESEAVELTEERMEAEVNLTLMPGLSISGFAVYKDGRPAPQVDVHIIPNLSELMAGNVAGMRRAEMHTVTDETGAFILEDLSPGEFRLHAGAMKPQEMFSPDRETRTVILDGTGDVTGVELVVEEGAAEIAGVVVDNWGSPIEGASVRIVNIQNMVATTTTEGALTGPDGTFAAAPSGSGPFHVQAAKQGYTSETVKDVAGGTANLEIVLKRHGQITGRVVAPDGRPPGPGGTVKAKQLKEESLLETVQRMAVQAQNQNPGAPVNNDGTFTVEAPAGRVELFAAVPGFAPGRSRPITVAPGETYTGIEIRLTAGAVLHGTVMLADGAPVAGAVVSASIAKEDGTENMFEKILPQFFAKGGNRATTDEKGRYEIAHLPEGKYTVSATHADYAPSDAVTVTAGPDQIVRVQRLLLSRGGAIAGKVVEDDAGKPGIMIQLISDGPITQAFSDAQGRFRFEGLKSGEYMLTIIDVAGMQQGKPRMKTRVVAVEGEETTELEVLFGMGYRVYGTIKGLPPAPMRMVTLRRPGGPAPEEIDPLDVKASVTAGSYQVGMGFVTDEGAYDVADVAPGTYILEIPKMPKDPTDMAAYAKMDRTPHYRKEITVKEKDLKLDIEIK